MPAGPDLMMRVSSHLLPDQGKSAAQIHKVLTVGCTPRAVRYAVSELLKDGRARRAGRMIFAAADLVVDVREEADTPPVKTAVPLRECFPDDNDAYSGARADLLHHGSTWTGGGAAAAFFLKLHEAA